MTGGKPDVGAAIVASYSLRAAQGAVKVYVRVCDRLGRAEGPCRPVAEGIVHADCAAEKAFDRLTDHWEIQIVPTGLVTDHDQFAFSPNPPKDGVQEAC